MVLTIDIGNTRAKWALFEGGRMVRRGVWEEGSAELAGVLVGCDPKPEVIVCATGRADLAAMGLEGQPVQMLSAATPLPIVLDYATPATLGADRIAAACGAYRLSKERGQSVGTVVVDAGTCVTIDYVDACGVYRGGAILPGLDMKFRALHTFTAKLPLIEDAGEGEQCVTGRSTREAMVAGVLTATRFAVEGFVRYYSRCEGCTRVLLTGGDAARLWSGGALQLEDCSIEPDLVMKGLYEIINYKLCL